MNLAALPALPAWADDACAPGQPGSDGPDRIARNVYDAAGQRLQLRVGVGTGDQAAEATWAYNRNGQVTTVIDGNGNRAELGYDGHMRQDRWTFPTPATYPSPTRPAPFDDSSQASALATAGPVNAADYESYGYDANGNRTELRKRDGSVLTYQYDALNRLTVKVVPERPGLTAAQTRDVYYGYDLADRQLYARFDSAGGPGVANVYDGFGRLTSTTADTDGTARTLAYQYDAAGGRTRITHPDPGPGQAPIRFDYARDSLDRPFWLSSSPAAGIHYQSWRSDGLPGSQSRGNGSSTWISRDGIGRLNGLGHYYGAGGTGDSTWLYAHNPASQIRTVTRDNDSYAWTGHYAVNRPYATNGLNQYTAAGPATFGYDANGNLTSDGVRTYVYDVENRLVSATPGGALAYDPLGRLYQLTASNGTVTRFLYDGDALVAEYDAAGEMTRRYVHWDGADVPVIAYAGATLASPTYLHPDHQGSIVALSGASGVTQINRYDEYGIPAAGNAGRFQYTGQIWLAELGLSYYKARMYSPGMGRFLQVDPVGYGDQFNLYAYVGNDPVNHTDPDGRQIMPGDARYEASRQVVGYLVWVAGDLVDLGQSIAQGRFEYAFGGLPPTLGGGVLSEVAVVPRAIGSAQTAARGEMAVGAARAEASAAVAEGRAGGAVSGLVTRDGRIFTGRCTTAGGPGRATSARVQSAVEGAPRGPYPGCCGEIDAISQAANAGANLRGAGVVTLRTVGRAVMPPCVTCRSVLRRFGIRF